jgi:hypothetical protein
VLVTVNVTPAVAGVAALSPTGRVRATASPRIASAAPA